MRITPGAARNYITLDRLEFEVVMDALWLYAAEISGNDPSVPARRTSAIAMEAHLRNLDRNDDAPIQITFTPTRKS